MATAPVSVENDLSCPICFKLFEDPHTPRCLSLCCHVCCEVCLQKMVEGKCQRTCPKCRNNINIPDDGNTSFTTITSRYRLRSLAESNRHVGGNLSQSQASPKKDGLSLCEDHDDEKMHYYCVTCKSLACQACLTLKHDGTGHKIEGVKELYKKQKDEMESAFNRAKSRIGDVENELSELKTAKIRSEEIYKNTKKQIDKYAESHINELLEETNELKRQVDQTEQLQKAGLDREIATLQKHVNCAKESYQATMIASENMPNYEYITQHTTLVNIMEDIQVSKPTMSPSKTKLDVIKFVPRLSHIKLGQIITPGKVRTIKKIQTLNGFVYACRLDSNTDGLLAIADFDGCTVAIYTIVNRKFEKKLNLKLASQKQYNPNGIANCPDGRFMVARHTCLEVYSPDGNHQNDIEIKESSRVNIHRLAVTSDDKILVGDYHRSLIVEISPTGKVIRTIHTSIRPYHMTLINDTHIAISNWEDGKVIVICIKSEQETLSVDIPMVDGICYDEQTECLLTARSEPADKTDKPGMVRYNTGVIEQYSYTTGKLVACLQQGLYHPQGIILTSEGHLIVANEKAVDIYEIQ